MRIYNEIAFDVDGNVIYEDSYEYSGEVELLKKEEVKTAIPITSLPDFSGFTFPDFSEFTFEPLNLDVLPFRWTYCNCFVNCKYCNQHICPVT